MEIQPKEYGMSWKRYLDFLYVKSVIPGLRWLSAPNVPKLVTPQAAPHTTPRQAMLLRLTPGVILLIGFLLRAWGLDFGLPGKYRPDEEYFVLHALGFHSGDLNPHGFVYPTFYMYVLSAVYKVYDWVGTAGGLFQGKNFLTFVQDTDQATIYHLGRWVTLCFGLATLWAVYALCRRRFDVKTAVVAMTILTMNFIHGRESKFITSDVPLTFFVVLSMFGMPSMAALGRWRDYALVGFTVGLAVSTKYTALFVGAAAAAMHLYGVFYLRRTWALREQLWKPLFSLSLLVVAIFLTSPYVFLDWRGCLEAVLAHQKNVMQGWNNFGIDFGLQWVITRGLGIGMGTVATVLAAVGFLLLLRKPSKIFSKHVLSLDIIAFTIAFLVLLIRSRYLFMRYFVPLAPIVAIMAAVAVVRIADLLRRDWQKTALLIALTLACVAEPTYRLVRTNLLFCRTDTREQLREWMQVNLPEGAKVGYANPYWHSRPNDLPKKIKYVPFEQILDGQVYGTNGLLARWVLGEEHVEKFYVRSIAPGPLALLNKQAKVVAIFNPFVAGSPTVPIFDTADAFWMPIGGFDGVERPGPKLTLYEFPPKQFDREQYAAQGLGLEATCVHGVAWDLASQPPAILDETPIKGDLIYKRIDPLIDFSWFEGDPALIAPFSVEWRGKLKIEKTGTYQFGTESDDGSALYIDKKLAVVNWGEHPKLKANSQVYLQAGGHELVIRYFNSVAKGGMRFIWHNSDGKEKAVPPRMLLQ